VRPRRSGRRSSWRIRAGSAPCFAIRSAGRAPRGCCAGSPACTAPVVRLMPWLWGGRLPRQQTRANEPGFFQRAEHIAEDGCGHPEQDQAWSRSRSPADRPEDSVRHHSRGPAEVPHPALVITEYTSIHQGAQELGVWPRASFASSPVRFHYRCRADHVLPREAGAPPIGGPSRSSTSGTPRRGGGG